MNFSSLNQILSPDDLKKLNSNELIPLCKAIRTKIIETLSIKGGHLSSNLGIVELSVALHYVFNSPFDKFIFDTSHQSYPHKLLTGRFSQFDTIRQYQGLCGFTHPKESLHDHFYAGHAGTAFSLALGMAKGRDLTGANNHVIPILGDASLTCGLTLEALNNIPGDLKKFIVVLNDNKMSISESVGNIKNILSRLLSHPKTNKIYQEIQFILSKIPGYGQQLAKQGQKVTESLKNLVSPAAFFEQFGLTYVGPIDGHDVKKLIDTFSSIKDFQKPLIIHVMTVKGKGMPVAIENPTAYHGVKPFDIESGKFLNNSSSSLTFPKIFGKHLLKMMKKDKTLTVVNPATPAGSCLSAAMKEYPKRCLDVGIAEGHAVTFAAGIAKLKTNVICNIYATFSQRALDNIFHDVCLQELPVVFTLDRAFISGPDGSTHHGIYDISFFSSMPNMIITQPRDGNILKELLESSFKWKLPTVIRYPNLITSEDEKILKFRPIGKADVLSKGKDYLIISLGHMNSTAILVKKHLEKYNIRPTLVDPVFVKPLDEMLFLELFKTHKNIITIEEHSLNHGLGALINQFIIKHKLQNELNILNIGIPDTFIQHGKNEQLYQELGLDEKSICMKIVNYFEINQELAHNDDHSLIS